MQHPVFNKITDWLHFLIDMSESAWRERRTIKMIQPSVYGLFYLCCKFSWFINKTQILFGPNREKCWPEVHSVIEKKYLILFWNLLLHYLFLIACTQCQTWVTSEAETKTNSGVVFSLELSQLPPHCSWYVCLAVCRCLLLNALRFWRCLWVRV